jgi:hypothetical protein
VRTLAHPSALHDRECDPVPDVFDRLRLETLDNYVLAPQSRSPAPPPRGAFIACRPLAAFRLTRRALFEVREMQRVVFDERLPDASATSQRDRACKCERRQRRSCGMARDRSGVGPTNRRSRRRVKAMEYASAEHNNAPRRRTTVTARAFHPTVHLSLAPARTRRRAARRRQEQVWKVF